MKATPYDSDDECPPKLPPWLKRWLLRGLSAFALWAAFAAVLAFCLGDIAKLGQWGDSFAPLTGIASTLAVVLATWSVNMQRRDLAMQREELQLTREEMKAQRLEMEAQRAAQEKSAKAQTVANTIALHAGKIEILRQIADVDTLATRALDGLAEHASITHPELTDVFDDTAELWWEMVRMQEGDLEQADYFPKLMTGRLRGLMGRRLLLKGYRDELERDTL